MFRIEEVRKNSRASLSISLFATHIAATAVVLMMVLGSSTASARRPPTPENFRVTATTAYTVTVAWNPPRNNSGNFNYYLSGAYGVEPAVLPQTATSHTFMRLHSGNQYWFFIYARDAGGQVRTGPGDDQNSFGYDNAVNGASDHGNRDRFQLRLRFFDSRAGRLPFSLLPSIGEWQPSHSPEP
jgi:hypothetical protein